MKKILLKQYVLGLFCLQSRTNAFLVGSNCCGQTSKYLGSTSSLWPQVNSQNRYFFSINTHTDEDEPESLDVKLKAMTIEELKEELRKHGLRVSGRKADLVQRLLDAGGPLTPPPPPSTEQVKVANPTEQAEAEVLGVGSAEEFRAESQRQREQEKAQQAASEANSNWKPFDDIGGLPERLNGSNPVIDDLMIRENVKIKSHSGEEFDAYVVQARAALQPWSVTKGLQKKFENEEVKTVLLLPDIYGWETEFSQNIADNISSVCEAVVMVPDLFRGNAWNQNTATQSQEYETWRASHPPERVQADIRASAAYLMKQFNGTSIALAGFCYGGGRAIEEAAAGYINPDALAVFYPARYDPNDTSRLQCPTVGIFAAEDHIAGATKEDAIKMHQILSNNEKVQDFVVRIFQGEGHAFAHIPGAAKEKQNAEDAILLATAWLDIFLRLENRTTGPAAKSQKALWDE
mmetsp:Transcript_22273/g.28835  ORF Transcript_22273/g.28835 Transcript_22273/m.28835 type:complete len:462 (-) Transcript_22273:234-1619(-)